MGPVSRMRFSVSSTELNTASQLRSK